MRNTVFESFSHLLILAPLFVWGYRKNKAGNFKPILYFVLIYVLSNLITSSFSDVTFFIGQQRNWVGKGLALIAGLLFIIILPAFNSTSFGLTCKIKRATTRPLLIFCFSYFLIRVGLYAASGNATLTINIETLLFQSTLPGIQEEILYRGILLGLLNTVFIIPRFKFLQVHFGLATIIISLLFGLAHGINMHNDFSLSFNYFSLLRTAFDGLLFALLTEKTKNILPAIVFHNLLNLIVLH